MVSAAQAVASDDFEIIYVNDGSPDESVRRACEIQSQDPRVVVVDLSRNFGHHKAILAGLSQARGERVFLLDVDLEESPEWLSEFWKEMDEKGADAVFGVQRERRGSAFRRWTGSLFYRLFNAVSDTKIPENLCTVRIMTREYVQTLTELKDQNVFLAGNVAWIGYRQEAIPVEKQVRRGTSYSLGRRIQLFWDGVTSFSSHPLQMVFMVGLVISCSAGLVGAFYLSRWMLWPEATLSGFTSLIISVWFLGGLNILFLGVIGYYVAKVFNEVKGRPQYVIRKVFRSDFD